MKLTCVPGVVIRHHIAGLLLAATCLCASFFNGARGSESVDHTLMRSGGTEGYSLGLKVHRIPLYWLDKPAMQPPGDYARWLPHQGRKRYYEMHVPPGCNPNNPCPVIIALHGGGGNPAGLRWQANMEAEADRQGYIVIYPAGTHALFRDKALFWNVGPKRKQKKLERIDDVAFLEVVLDDAARYFNLDPKRVYATGISNGSHMAYRFAAESDRLAAVAGIAGQERLGKYYQAPGRPVPVIHFHGTQDSWNPIDGAVTSNASGFESRVLPALADHIRDWSENNGCRINPERAEVTDRHERQVCDQGEMGSEVIRYLLLDGGHTWPGGRVSKLESTGRIGGVRIGPGGVGPVSQLDANHLMMQFFGKHSRQPH